MTRKRRKKDPESADSAQPENVQPADAAESSKKISLPAFGFATDLVAGNEREPAPADGTPATGEDRIFDFADRLERGAAAAEEEAAPVRLETWVSFSLAGEVFALPVEPVQEVVRVASITRVPHAPSPIRGVTNLRGRVIPVIDLRLRIGLEPTELRRATRVVTVNSRGRTLGLLVDAVHQVIHIDVDRIQPPPDDVMTVQSDYLIGVYHLDDHLVLLLDVDRAMIIREATATDTPAPATEPAAGETAEGNA